MRRSTCACFWAAVVTLAILQRPASADQWQLIPDDDTSSHTAPQTPPFRTMESAPDPSLKIGRLIEDFRQMKSLPANYEAEGLEFSSTGLQLAKGVTRGSFYSPAIPLMQPSNAAVTRWIADVPNLGDLKVEMCMSADRIHWTRWVGRDHKTAVLEAGEATVPPGAEEWFEGGMIAHGFRLYTHIRYRVTLSGTGTDSPVLERLMLWHNDSTEGQGYVATLDRVALEDKEPQTTRTAEKKSDHPGAPSK